MRQQVRQGDVCLVPLATVPDSDLGTVVQESDKNRVVLAHGEATGHAHALYPEKEPEPSRITLYGFPGIRRHVRLRDDALGEAVARDASLLRLTAPVALRHEEHALILLPAGDWAVLRQVEHDGLEEARRVAD